MAKETFYCIKKVQEYDTDQVVEFMKRMRSENFPMANHHKLPLDIRHFESYYVDQTDAGLFASVNNEGKVLGTIGYLPYDGRFDSLLDIKNPVKTTELVRCYVDSDYRRLGIGSSLYNKVLSSIREAGYQTIYLHTHSFLPGGPSFWKAKGFEEKVAEQDPVWQTLHMEKQI
ncbi:GNAT family N-acetyltransferase [Ornithinibacillus gellani]|uniref:GNAT family N-acetyltransferase n=1 Tax=Ornithinibacillus gellani TaxID=2293253 RepID=UPI000F47B819|nr:GNAT family N-acetyltransferase [Ornithinibacillus gellani]TQS75017.1 GNAT family N-acetyltransferase [Ornithinibacillus gellani]